MFTTALLPFLLWDVGHDGGMTEPEPQDLVDVSDEHVVQFWNTARSRVGVRLTEAIIGADWTSMIPPPAWAFGSGPDQANRLLAQVLAGLKTATSSALEEYTRAAERMPEVGDVSIVVDGDGMPGALIRTTAVDHIAFSEIDDAAAALEGELSLAEWQSAHRAFFSQSLGVPAASVGPDFQVVFEHFEVLYPDLPA